VLLMRLTLSNCTFREIITLLSNADGVNSPITVQLVAVIFQLRKLKCLSIFGHTRTGLLSSGTSFKIKEYSMF